LKPEARETHSRFRKLGRGGNEREKRAAPRREAGNLNEPVVF
jgi:hypothetical protein